MKPYHLNMLTLTRKFMNEEIDPLPFYQLFGYMENDPEGFSTLDPLLIVRGSKVYLESVDKQGRRSLLLNSLLTWNLKS